MGACTSRWLGQVCSRQSACTGAGPHRRVRDAEQHRSQVCSPAFLQMLQLPAVAAHHPAHAAQASELEPQACAGSAHAACTAQHTSFMPQRPHAPADVACCRFRDVAMHCTALVWAGPEKGDDVYERFRGCRRPGTNRLIGGGWPLQVHKLSCCHAHTQRAPVPQQTD